MAETVLQDRKTLARKLYSLGGRLHDLWIVLAWGALLAALFLDIFYNRSCYQFVVIQDVNAPCIEMFDWIRVFLIAVGGGILISDERVAVLGFLLAHVVSTGIFLVALTLPPVLAGADVAVTSLVLSQSAILAFNYQFPFSIFFSFIGTFIGLYIGSKIPEEQEESHWGEQEPLEGSHV